MRLALRAVGLLVEQLLGALEVAFMRGMAGGSERDAQRRGVLAHRVLVGSLRLLRLPHDVGDQRLVIVEIELRPLGLLGHFEQLQRPLAVAGGSRGPGAGECARQLADRAIGSLAKLVVGGLVVARLEAVDAEQQVRHAVVRILGDELAGERNGAVPMALGGLGLEGLLEEHGVDGIEGQRTAVERGGAVVVVNALGEVGGKIAAEQRMGVRLGREVVGSLGRADGGEHAVSDCSCAQYLAKAGPHSDRSFLEARGRFPPRHTVAHIEAIWRPRGSG